MTRLRLIALALLPLATALAGPDPGAAQQDVPVFGHAVITDPQRTASEPDLTLAADGTVYSSFPFGFTSGMSFVYASHDHGNSFQLVPGNLPGGKPATCYGGGDTDLRADEGGTGLFFSDLQGTGPSASDAVSSDGGASWAVNCDGFVSNSGGVDRMWFGVHGKLGSNLLLYQDVDDLSNPNGLPVLVDELSTDGQTFTPIVNPNATTDCPATDASLGITDCVTDDEGIAGNQVVAANGTDTYIVHSSRNGARVVVEHGSITPGTTPQGTWAHMTVHDGGTYSDGNPRTVVVLIPDMAIDGAGNLYVAWAELPLSDATAGIPTGPPQAYFATLTAGSPAWSPPHLLSQGGSDVMPWIAAGDPGRIDIAYDHTNEVSEGGKYGSDNLAHAFWTVQMAQSLNALSGAPTITTSLVSAYPNKYGGVCTMGSGCTGDRSLGDFLEVQSGLQGRAMVSYVDDATQVQVTDPSSGATTTAGMENVAFQVQGPSLYASVGDLPTTAGGPPGLAMDGVSDPTGDAFYPAGGTTTPASPNLDLVQSSMSANTQAVTVRMRVAGAPDAGISAALGGTGGLWITRWNVPDPRGDAHTFYAGMELPPGSSTPNYFDGEIACGIATTKCKYLSYPETNLISGTFSSDGSIVLQVPAGDVALHPFPQTPWWQTPTGPAAGSTFYDVTSFTATEAQPNTSPSIFNVMDLTSPYDVAVGSAPASSPTPTAIVRPRSTSLPNTARAPDMRTSVRLALAWLLLPPLGLLTLGAAGQLRRRRRHSTPR